MQLCKPHVHLTSICFSFPESELESNVLTTLIIGIIMDNKRFDTWLIQVTGPVYDPQSVLIRTEKNVFYANWIGFTN